MTRTAGGTWDMVNGFAEISLPSEERRPLVDMMRARIRRLSHLDAAGADEFSEISRLARMCYVLSATPDGSHSKVGRLSREDVDSLYVLPHDRSTEHVLALLNEVRGLATRTGCVDLDMADLAAKSVYEVMDG